MFNNPPRRQAVTGNQIVEFRQAFAVMTTPYFLSTAFGPVETREECIQSADRTFRRMQSVMDGQSVEAASTLTSSTLALTSKEEMMVVNLQQMTEWMFEGFPKEHARERSNGMMELLCPGNSKGLVEKIQFVKAMDSIYKEVRLLENAVANTSNVDRQYEKVINIFFYVTTALIAYGILGLDLSKLWISLSSLLLSSAFMIGPACAQAFEGVILVLGRQPYDIGDRVFFVSIVSFLNGTRGCC